MQLYRFSPIDSKAKLLEAIEYIHASCFDLCKQTFGTYLPVVGNIGVFCHYEDEYALLTQIRKELTDESDNLNQKYYHLLEPIVIASKEGMPTTTYTRLYIRKPDPYRSQVGDVDFALDTQKYAEFKNSVKSSLLTKGARIFERPDSDMIELYNPDSDVLAYVVSK
jgi:hypothetical protein